MFCLYFFCAALSFFIFELNNIITSLFRKAACWGLNPPASWKQKEIPGHPRRSPASPEGVVLFSAQNWPVYINHPKTHSKFLNNYIKPQSILKKKKKKKKKLPSIQNNLRLFAHLLFGRIAQQRIDLHALIAHASRPLVAPQLVRFSGFCRGKIKILKNNGKKLETTWKKKGVKQQEICKVRWMNTKRKSFCRLLV